MKHLTTAALVCAIALPAAGQTNAQHAAYRAMIYTPVAGLPPLPPSLESLGRRGTSRVTLSGRVGHLSREGGLSIKTLGLGVEIPAERWRLGATFAYLAASCGEDWEGDSDCSGDIMLGASARRTLTSKPLGDGVATEKRRRASSSSDATLVVGFEGTGGFSPRQGEQAMAVSLGLPTAIVFQNGSTRITPFLTPGIGYGRMGHTAYEPDDVVRTYSSYTFLIGGGIGLQFGRSGLGTTLGFQKVFNGEGAMQLGVGMTWQGLTTR